MKLGNSPVESIVFQGLPFYIKRDDLLESAFSGNKARKLYHYLNGEFPDTTKLVSYGSVQSNFLYSLSALARLKGLVRTGIMEAAISLEVITGSSSNLGAQLLEVGRIKTSYVANASWICRRTSSLSF